MSCRQVFCYRGAAAGGGGLIEGPALYGHSSTWSSPTMAAARRTVFRWTGQLSNLVVRVSAAPGVGKSWTYTFWKNGVATALAVTISDAATDGRSTAVVSIAPGDTGYWARTFTGVGPTSHSPKLTFEFIHADDYVSGYSGLYDALGASPGRFGPLSPQSQREEFNVIPIAGSLTALDYVLETAPGSGKSRLLTLYKNNVAQDGSGGTPDTRVTIADLATTGSWSGTVALVPGDYIDLRDVATSSPANSAVSISSTFTATTDGESIVPGTIIPVAPTEYFAPEEQSIGAGDHSATEGDVEVLGGISSFELSDWYGRWSASGYGGTHAYNTRLNNATPGSPLNLGFTAAALTDADTTDSMSVVDGDVWSVQVTSGQSNFGGVYLVHAWKQFAIGEPIQIVGSHVIGADGTVDTSRTGLINLDGVTRTVSGSGIEFIGASLGMIEQATAPAGQANMGMLYTEDDGSGKTRLVIKFGTGAAIVIATEV
jgi:hypothetical protein